MGIALAISTHNSLAAEPTLTDQILANGNNQTIRTGGDIIDSSGNYVVRDGQPVNQNQQTQTQRPQTQRPQQQTSNRPTNTTPAQQTNRPATNPSGQTPTTPSNNAGLGNQSGNPMGNMTNPMQNMQNPGQNMQGQMQNMQNQMQNPMQGMQNPMQGMGGNGGMPSMPQQPTMPQMSGGGGGNCESLSKQIVQMNQMRTRALESGGFKYGGDEQKRKSSPAYQGVQQVRKLALQSQQGEIYCNLFAPELKQTRPLNYTGTIVKSDAPPSAPGEPAVVRNKTYDYEPGQSGTTASGNNNNGNAGNI